MDLVAVVGEEGETKLLQILEAGEGNHPVPVLEVGMGVVKVMRGLGWVVGIHLGWNLRVGMEDGRVVDRRHYPFGVGGRFRLPLVGMLIVSRFGLGLGSWVDEGRLVRGSGYRQDWDTIRMEDEYGRGRGSSIATGSQLRSSSPYRTSTPSQITQHPNHARLHPNKSRTRPHPHRRRIRLKNQTYEQ